MPEVSIKVIDRTIRVACEDAEYAATLNATNFLRSVLTKIPDENKEYGSSTVLLLVGLNLADRILSMSNENSVGTSAMGTYLPPSSEFSQETLKVLKAMAELAESIADRLEKQLGANVGATVPSEPSGNSIKT